MNSNGLSLGTFNELSTSVHHSYWRRASSTVTPVIQSHFLLYQQHIKWRDNPVITQTLPMIVCANICVLRVKANQIMPDYNTSLWTHQSHQTQIWHKSLISTWWMMNAVCWWRGAHQWDWILRVISVLNTATLPVLYHEFYLQKCCYRVKTTNRQSSEQMSFASSVVVLIVQHYKWQWRYWKKERSMSACWYWTITQIQDKRILNPTVVMLH